jgi:hypothetical protein
MVGKLPSRWYVVLVLVAVLAGLLVPMLAGTAEAKKKPKVNSAMGKGKIVQPVGDSENTLKFEFNAKEAETQQGSDDARGTFEFGLDYPAFGVTGEMKGEVECLRVDGGAATLIAKINKGSGVYTGNVGKFVRVEVLDTGKPKGEGDQFSSFTQESNTCATPAGGGVPITDGNITVKDVAVPA